MKAGHCPHCGSGETQVYWRKPAVGIYEGATVYKECFFCGHHWTGNTQAEEVRIVRMRQRLKEAFSRA
jgi:Zn ribbon nucleic-acid-binding protein